MVRVCVRGSAFGAVFWITSVAHAQCTKDTDCKGERICEAGACRWPALETAQDPNGWDVGIAAVPEDAVETPRADGAESAKPATVAAPTTTAVPPAKPGVALDMREPTGGDPPSQEKPRMVHRSVGMMTTGIVLVSIAPIPLIAGMISAIDRCQLSYSEYDRDCRDSGPAIGLTLAGLALVGIGVPLIVAGGKRVSAKEPWQAAVLPYATPDGAGIGLRLKL